MSSLFDGVRDWFDRVTNLVPSCGPTKDACRVNSTDKSHGVSHEVFALKPLAEAAADAQRATNKAVRLLRDGAVEAGIRELHDAKQLAPRSATACCNVGCAYERSGQDASALTMYREALRLAPKDPTAVLAVSILEHRRGQSEDAQRLLVNFLKEVDPAHVGALQQLGYLHQSRGNWSQAAGCFHRLIAVDHNNTEWPTQLQQCLEQVPLKDEHGNTVGQDTGRSGGKIARAFSFSEPVAHGAIIDGVKEAESGRGQYQEAARLRQQGNPGAALRIYEGILRSDSRNVEALKGCVFCRSDMGDVAAALEVAEQLLPSLQDEPEANLYMAELLLRQTLPKAEEVERLLRRAAAKSTSPSSTGRMAAMQTASAGGEDFSLRLLCAQAEVAMIKEDSAQALNFANEAVRLDAGSPVALLELAKVRIRIAEYDAALRALSACLEVCGRGDGRLSPHQLRQRALAHAHRAQAHERLRQNDSALQQVQCALDLDDSPELSIAHVVKSMALNASGRTREAERELLDLLRRDPMNAEARLQLGYLQLSQSDSRAAATLQDLIAGPRETPPRIQGAAKVYLALAMSSSLGSRQDSKVERALRDGVQLHRNLRHVWKELEDSRSEAPQAAVQRLRSICDLDLNSTQARQLLELLARVMGRQDLASATTGSQSEPCRRLGRQSSIPPHRLAPTAQGMSSTAATGSSRGRSYSRGRDGSRHPSADPGFMRTDSSHRSSAWGQVSKPHPPGVSSNNGRSMSPMHLANASTAASTGYPAASATSSSRAQSRGWSPARSTNHGGLATGNSTPSAGVELGWDEVIEPSQLQFGQALGSGGSAQVYKGRWNGHDVAIKKISGAAHLEELRKEINALRKLRHPRLVRFFGACVQPPLLLVVMEYMAGGSLYSRLYSQNAQPLQEVQRWAIALQCVEGVMYLHANRVVHRDLKSMNVLLDNAGNARICDFGLAHNMEATHIPRQLSGEGGSPRYMAPELYDPAIGKITEKVDIWAMACVLIELFSGQIPYQDCSTMAQLSTRILVERRPPAVPARVPAPMASLIMRCLAFDPKSRLSASELGHELGQLRQTSG